MEESRYGIDKYGDPLDVLGEEACEVGQAVFKLRRFGEEGTAYGREHGKPAPKAALIQEIGDFLVALEICIKLGCINSEQITAAMAVKEARLTQLYGPTVLG